MKQWAVIEKARINRNLGSARYMHESNLIFITFFECIMISKLRYLVGIVLIVCLMPIVSQGQDDSKKDSAERAHRKAVVKKDWKKTKNAVNKTYNKAKHLPGKTY